MRQRNKSQHRVNRRIRIELVKVFKPGQHREMLCCWVRERSLKLKHICKFLLLLRLYTYICTSKSHRSPGH
ncbi:hypothetical protein AAHA92_29779 [Salvia divinorum]|uniref:Uncharacterized protein n=1 Tax=Salvia divinorum TaxID=28513 RepID=A0ABD1FZH5_SALDI